MNTQIKRIIALASFVMMFTAASFAQSTITKLMKKIEASAKDNVETIFTEQRDPNTKEVTYSYNTFVIKNNASLLDEIEQAIVQERENSIKFEKYRDITTVKFKDGTSYTLNRNSTNKGTFYVEKYSRNIRKKK
jgi:lipopolysaccharide export LptBFGC system permease protein LptF